MSLHMSYDSTIFRLANFIFPSMLTKALSIVHRSIQISWTVTHCCPLIILFSLAYSKFISDMPSVMVVSHLCSAPLQPFSQTVSVMGIQQNHAFTIGNLAIPAFLCSNSRNFSTKKAVAFPRTSKWPGDRGLPSTLSWKWPCATLSSSFGLFHN